MANAFDDVEVPAGIGAPIPAPAGRNAFGDIEVPGQVVVPSGTATVSAMPPQVSAWTRYPRYLAGGLVSGLAQGLMGPEAALGNYFYPSGNWPTPDVINKFSRWMTGLGDVTMRPSPGLESVGLGAIEGAGAALPAALVGAEVGAPAWLPRTFGQVGRMAASTGVGVGSGAVAGGTEEAAREAGLPAPGAIGALAGMGAGGALALGARTGEAALGQFHPQWEPYAAAGIPARSLALTSRDPLVRRLMTPGLPKEAIQQDLGNAIEATATRLSPQNDVRTWQQLGTSAQQQAREWIDGTPQQIAAQQPSASRQLEQQAWAPVDAGMTGIPTPRSNLDAAIAKLATQPGPNAAIERILGPRTADRLQAANQAQQNLANLTGAATPTPTWEQMHQTKQIIGDALANPTIAPDLSASQKESLYRAASQDMQATAYRNGLQSEFDNANQVSNSINQFKRNVLSNVTTSSTGARETIDPEKAGQWLLSTLRKGDTSIAQLRQFGLGQVADEAAALHLRLNGLADPSNAASSISPKWATAWQGLKTAGSHQQLFNDPRISDGLESIAGLANRINAIKPGEAMKVLPSALTMGNIAALGSIVMGHSPTGSEAQVLHFLAGEAGGGLVGTAMPWLARTAIDPLSRSSLLARYGATPPVGNLLTRGLGVGAGTFAAGNPLMPQQGQ